MLVLALMVRASEAFNKGFMALKSVSLACLTARAPHRAGRTRDKPGGIKKRENHRRFCDVDYGCVMLITAVFQGGGYYYNAKKDRNVAHYSFTNTGNNVASASRRKTSEMNPQCLVALASSTHLQPHPHGAQRNGRLRHR